jgi:hypothetical protein
VIVSLGDCQQTAAMAAQASGAFEFRFDRKDLRSHAVTMRFPVRAQVAQESAPLSQGQLFPQLLRVGRSAVNNGTPAHALPHGLMHIEANKVKSAAGWCAEMIGRDG